MKNTNSRKILNTFFQILLAICIFLFSVSASVILTLSFRPLYYIDMDLLDIPQKSGLDEDTVRENYDALIDYNLRFSGDELVLPSLAMSDNGRTHFAEVKELFNVIKISALVLLPICIFGIVWFVRKKRYTFLRYAGWITVSAPIFVGLLVLINWEAIFRLFHKIVFRNEYWVFYPQYDPIIRILPSDFFMHCAVMIVALVLVSGIICLLLWRKKRLSQMIDE